jgi:hypothetical protein
MDRISKLLLPALSRKGLAGTATSAQICFYAKKWGKGRFSAISYSKGTLKLSCRSSSAAQDLDMEREKLMDHINTKMKRDIVKSIRIINAN